MKIYTKAGDDGKTSLFGGKRIPKYADRIESYGTVDELNSFIGLLKDGLGDSVLSPQLLVIQHNLFNIGSVLATDKDADFNLPGVGPDDVAEIERNIDLLQAQLTPLKNFILPGGDTRVSHAHICRTVCRRAERRVVAVHAQEPLDTHIILYLNRLSDYFFVLARYIAHVNGINEIKWESK